MAESVSGNFDMENVLRSELGSGETIKWSGQPDPSRATKGTWPIIVFGLFWEGFSLFWIAGAAGFKVPDFTHFKPQMLFPLFGLPFAVIGLFMLTVPFWSKKTALRTIYAVTNKRAIILVNGVNKMVHSFGPDQLQNIERIEKADGSGDIILTRAPFGNQNLNNTNRSAMPVGFLGIADVKSVEKWIREVSEKKAS